MFVCSMLLRVARTFLTVVVAKTFAPFVVAKIFVIFAVTACACTPGGSGTG
jgi:hypothetical protein